MVSANLRSWSCWWATSNVRPARPERIWGSRLEDLIRWLKLTCWLRNKNIAFFIEMNILEWKWVSSWNGNFGGRVGIYRFLLSPPILRMLPSLFNCRDFSLFVPSTMWVQACRPEGLQWVHALGEVQLFLLWALFFYQLKVVCGSTTPLSLRKFPLRKVVESPW